MRWVLFQVLVQEMLPVRGGPGGRRSPPSLPGFGQDGVPVLGQSTGSGRSRARPQCRSGDGWSSWVNRAPLAAVSAAVSFLRDCRRGGSWWLRHPRAPWAGPWHLPTMKLAAGISHCRDAPFDPPGCCSLPCRVPGAGFRAVLSGAAGGTRGDAAKVGTVQSEGPALAPGTAALSSLRRGDSEGRREGDDGGGCLTQKCPVRVCSPRSPPPPGSRAPLGPPPPVPR